MLVLLTGCSVKLDGTKVTGVELVQAINEDRRSIALMSAAMVEIIKRLNKIDPPNKEEVKK